MDSVNHIISNLHFTTKPLNNVKPSSISTTATTILKEQTLDIKDVPRDVLDYVILPYLDLKSLYLFAKNVPSIELSLKNSIWKAIGKKYGIEEKLIDKCPPNFSIEEFVNNQILVQRERARSVIFSFIGKIIDKIDLDPSNNTLYEKLRIRAEKLNYAIFYNAICAKDDQIKSDTEIDEKILAFKKDLQDNKFSHVNKLVIKDGRITEIPAEINLLTNLIQIKCTGNDLIEFPSISNLSSLVEIILDYNKLRSLPDFSHCKLLEKIHFQHNQISHFPPISNFLHLRSVYANHNDLMQIPALENIPHFKTLFLSNNQLKKLPDLSSFKNLKALSVSHNFITSLPPLPNSLTFVSCSYNKLAALPSFFTQLETLFCCENPLIKKPVKHEYPNLIQNDFYRIKKVVQTPLIYLDDIE